MINSIKQNQQSPNNNRKIRYIFIALGVAVVVGATIIFSPVIENQQITSKVKNLIEVDCQGTHEGVWYCNKVKIVTDKVEYQGNDTYAIGQATFLDQTRWWAFAKKSGGLLSLVFEDPQKQYPSCHEVRDFPPGIFDLRLLFCFNDNTGQNINRAGIDGSLAKLNDQLKNETSMFSYTQFHPNASFSVTFPINWFASNTYQSTAPAGDPACDTNPGSGCRLKYKDIKDCLASMIGFDELTSNKNLQAIIQDETKGKGTVKEISLPDITAAYLVDEMSVCNEVKNIYFRDSFGDNYVIHTTRLSNEGIQQFIKTFEYWPNAANSTNPEEITYLLPKDISGNWFGADIVTYWTDLVVGKTIPIYASFNLKQNGKKLTGFLCTGEIIDNNVDGCDKKYTLEGVQENNRWNITFTSPNSSHIEAVFKGNGVKELINWNVLLHLDGVEINSMVLAKEILNRDDYSTILSILLNNKSLSDADSGTINNKDFDFGLFRKDGNYVEASLCNYGCDSYILVQENNIWTYITHTRKGTAYPDCDVIDKYHVPMSMYQSCFKKSGDVEVKRQGREER